MEQIWTLGPRIYHQDTLKNTRKLWEHPKKYYFHIWESEILKSVEGLCTYLFEFSNVCFQIYLRTFHSLRTSNFETLEILFFGTLIFEFLIF